jgi:hypothetical protein
MIMKNRFQIRHQDPPRGRVLIKTASAKNARKIFFWIILIVLTIGIIEASSFLVCLFFQRKGILYRPPVSKSYSNYIATRDVTAGWPDPKTFGHDGRRDITGSRIIPAFSDPTKYTAWISLYGDSFTWSSEVDSEHAWSNILSKMTRTRVSNYGVPGYGTDQAFLRFFHNTDDQAQIVFLNHLSQNIMRNVNQYRELISPGDGSRFKPRYILDQRGHLALVRLPSFSETEYYGAIRNPERYLPHEFFVPGGPSGIQYFSFPYTWTTLKAFQNFHVKAVLLGRHVAHAEFYMPDHLSKALPITSGILTRFHEEARIRGKIPIITTIPTGRDLEFFRKKNYWPYQALIDQLSQQQIEVLNFGDGIMRHLGTKDIDVLFKNISGHFNETGYRILAEVAFRHLTERHLLLSKESQARASAADTVKTRR